MILLACLALLLSLGVAERVALVRARRAVPIRIHVNGTRGKSTVTRLVAAALREAGIPTLAKVTGTAPRLILPDGTERTVRRWAPANIREQAWVLRQARRCGARALVVECMAVRPDLQWTSERDVLHSTHGVITNVRLDHTGVMGASLDEIARSLANTVPRGGVLITGDRRAASVFADRCAREGSRLVMAGQDADGISPDPICLAVARELGIDEATARRGMQRAVADPGAASRGTVVVSGRSIEWMDVTAANDPESTDLLVADWALRLALPQEGARSGQAGGVMCVYNHRDDRPDRLVTFARGSRLFTSAAHLVVTGERPSLLLMRRVRRGRVRFVAPRRLAVELAAMLVAHPGITRIVYCGNTRGFVRPVLDGHAARRTDG